MMAEKQPFLPLDARFGSKNGEALVPRQLPLALERPLPFSIDNFIVSAANQKAFAMLESWPRWPSPVTILVGGAMSGKSHLAAVWAAQAYAVQGDKTQLDKAAASAAQATPIILEDMDSGPFDETHLFHLINMVRQARAEKPQAALLMTARRRPALWDIALPDLVSRLKAANLAEINAADDILLQAVLAKLFADRQLAVDADISRFILNRCERSLARLAEIVAALDTLALERQSRITRALAAEVLEAQAAGDENSAEALPAGILPV